MMQFPYILFVLGFISQLQCIEDNNKTSIFVDQEFIRLYLFTESNTTIPDWTFRLNETSMNVSSYNSNNSMVIILHGFQNSANDSLIHLIKHAYLSRGGWNIIMVDWSVLAKVNQYEVAVKNAFSISLLLAQWLSDVIHRKYISTSNIHLVGFSIGAHMAGIMAKRVNNGKIAKIFALDPAFPIYNQKPESERLHINDAEFVQVIHTCGHHVSYETSLGHVDFYPNGGTFPQPDCLYIKSEVWGLDIIMVIVCSHNIVLRYFAETIFNEFQFTAVRCDSWVQFKRGNCSSERVPMGYATPANSTGNYYLNLHLNISTADIINTLAPIVPKSPIKIT